MERLEGTAREAGALIMACRAGGLFVENKHDNSPVTEADKQADALICHALRGLTPHIPIISEEGTQDASVALSGTFWCVDSLDGTKGFIRGEDNFTVNIGLIDNHVPVMGVIYLPATGWLYAGKMGDGASRVHPDGTRQTIHVRTLLHTGVTAVTSHRHASHEEQEMAARYGVTQSIPMSSSVKFCRVAEGEADIYPRFGTTMEWDTAAGDAIVRAAGGMVIDTAHNAPMRYGKPHFRNGGFVAYGGRSLI
jgi:3'(2'), 5'-bisphosphate nucleotidase